jgi:RNA polymerase sigma-70 factor (ECF subfamily)
MTDGERARVVEDLVEQHYELLYRFAYRLSGSAADAEDLVQQAFLTAQAKLDQLRETGKARSWLLTIVRNCFLKSKRRPEFAAFESFDQLADSSPEGELDGPVDREEIQTILEEMPEEFRTPLILFYFQEQSYKQVAEQMATPIGTVMSRLSRAKSFLRTRLLQRLGDELPVSATTRNQGDE